MEEPLKDILKTNRTFAELTAAQRKKLAEWCADEQEFQAMKSLFQQVEVWSENKDHDKNTKQRLDQLFAFEYAGKQSSDGHASSNQRFLSLKAWIPISAVAAALVFTWYLYPTSPRVQLAKNETQKVEQVHKPSTILKKTRQAENGEMEQMKREVEPKENVHEEHIANDALSAANSEAAAALLAVPSNESFSNSLASGSSVTLSSTGMATYSWSEAPIAVLQMQAKSKFKNRKDQVDGRMEKDAFTAFSLKSMPEILDVLVASY